MTETPRDGLDEAAVDRLYDGGGEGADLAGLREMRGVLRAMAAATDQEPPAGGVEMLMAAARAQARVAKPSRRRWAAIASHPGLAAAATLVLVAGVAGTLYLKGEGKLAEPTAPAMAPAPAQTRDQQVAASERAPAAGSAAAAAEPTPTPTVPEQPVTATVDKIAPPRAGAGESGAGKAGGAATATPGRILEPSADLDDLDDRRAPAKPAGDAPTFAPPPPPPPPAAKPAPAPATRAKADAPAPTMADRDVNVGDGALAGASVDAEETAPERAPGVDVVQLTRQAHTAAQKGQCAVVAALAKKVKVANASYYRDSFLSDPAIAACLRK